MAKRDDETVAFAGAGKLLALYAAFGAGVYALIGYGLLHIF